MVDLVPFTAIDLSKLDPPTVVEQLAYDVVFSELLTEFTGRDDTYTILLESDPAIKLLEVSAFREHILRQDFNDRALQLLLAYATGVNLEHLGALYNITRQLVRPADTTVFPPIKAIWESDSRLRQRIQLAPETFSVAGPAGAYIGHSFNADPRVKDVDAFSPSPGEAVISILSSIGDGTASDALCQVVYDYLYPRRPMTDHVVVRSGTVLPYTIQATLIIDGGPDPLIVRRQAADKLAAYTKLTHALGVKVSRSSIEAALTVGGVNQVILQDGFPVVIQPAHDQATYCTTAYVGVSR